MHWQFAGERFSVGHGADGRRRIGLDITWHKPVGWVGGLRPELSVPDLLSLFSRHMTVELFCGTPEELIERATNYVQMTSGARLGGFEYLPRSMILTREEPEPTVEITVALEQPQIEPIAQDLLSFGCASQPKFFRGQLDAQVLYMGVRQLKATNEDIARFLKGDIPAMTEEAPSFFVHIGMPPPAVTERNLLSDIKAQFE